MKKEDLIKMVFITNNLFCCNPPFNFYPLSLAKTHHRGYKSNDGFQTMGADHLTKQFWLKVKWNMRKFVQKLWTPPDCLHENLELFFFFFLCRIPVQHNPEKKAKP